MTNLPATDRHGAVYDRLNTLGRAEPLLIAHGEVEREGTSVDLRVDDLERPSPTPRPRLAVRSFH